MRNIHAPLIAVRGGDGPLILLTAGVGVKMPAAIPAQITAARMRHGHIGDITPRCTLVLPALTTWFGTT